MDAARETVFSLGKLVDAHDRRGGPWRGDRALEELLARFDGLAEAVPLTRQRVEIGERQLFALADLDRVGRVAPRGDHDHGRRPTAGFRRYRGRGNDQTEPG